MASAEPLLFPSIKGSKRRGQDGSRVEQGAKQQGFIDESAALAQVLDEPGDRYGADSFLLFWVS